MSATHEGWTGKARYAIHHDEPAWSAKLTTAIRCRFEGGDRGWWALFDTGAEWSMIGGGEASRLRAAVGGEGGALTMTTRLGAFEGTLERVEVSFVADQGADLVLEATVLLAPGWPGPPVLGMRGLLERVRFELHPDVRGDDHRWSFAPADDE